MDYLEPELLHSADMISREEVKTGRVAQAKGYLSPGVSGSDALLKLFRGAIEFMVPKSTVGCKTIIA